MTLLRHRVATLPVRWTARWRRFDRDSACIRPGAVEMRPGQAAGTVMPQGEAASRRARRVELDRDFGLVGLAQSLLEQRRVAGPVRLRQQVVGISQQLVHAQQVLLDLLHRDRHDVQALRLEQLLHGQGVVSQLARVRLHATVHRGPGIGRQALELVDACEGRRHPRVHARTPGVSRRVLVRRSVLGSVARVSPGSAVGVDVTDHGRRGQPGQQRIDSRRLRIDGVRRDVDGDLQHRVTRQAPAIKPLDDAPRGRAGVLQAELICAA